MRSPRPARPARPVRPALPAPVAGVIGIVLALAVTLLAASPALASTYRYWSFWDGAGGTWAYAAQGPSSLRPADGSVQGFHFVVSKDAADQAAPPRTAPDFAAICSATAPAAGKKRIALVIDFGTPAEAQAGETPPQDAPRTACAQVGPDATTAEALAEVAKPLRYNSAALLCAISGYPKQGCGEPIADTATPTATAPAEPAADAAAGSEGGGPSAGLLAGIAAVAALGAATLWQSRRRRAR
ncbi:SCO2322 family protein [Streptomyces sp. NBC_00347]|uniref:SCO2322 family protein n=1 Tax=Streptomyces sp. NBC_00347 TaxID=2975721 RepID=UPI002251F10D|nr:SCO2322 family protein [Streptomyces sp. NBC_00347]MCX5125540.1 SCO2322 family protein [Streptomyces sp. NBC_00347]